MTARCIRRGPPPPLQITFEIRHLTSNTFLIVPFHPLPPATLKMRLAAPVQLLLLALGAAPSTASPLGAAADGIEVAARTSYAIESAPVDKRSFHRSCRKCKLMDAKTKNPVLSCECPRTDGQWAWAELELTRCLANRDGILAWAVKYAPHIPSWACPAWLLTILVPIFLVGTLQAAAGTIS